MTTPGDLLALVEGYLDELALTPELGELAEPIRYALAGGGKRIRPVLCLATGEALGREPEELLPAGAAVELVHNFSLVHDDLPSLDNDQLRRGRPSTWARFDEATAVLAGDALLAEAARLALSYPTPHVARELVQATLGMIGGQQLDLKGGADLETLHRLKTGRLFYASVASALWVAELPEADQKLWRAFAEELGLLFQAVDDILDGDGYVLTHGEEGARKVADDAAARAQARLDEIDADTSVLEEIVAGLATRTA
ncbi:MAG TPA: polyprenyl synthetase family protein [Gaiellaceae bacterium]|jgi:geranylgeranyl pyrophosphate synthase|nr:polyprenyl synthetase family protein [Gaiellaceae bacterium]